MRLKDAYDIGFDTGYSIAHANWSESTGNTYLEEEAFVTVCLETESDHLRQFSPFEFHANEFNTSRNPERTWEKYEHGVYRGILAYIKDIKTHNP
jgi:hypothetical protein